MDARPCALVVDDERDIATLVADVLAALGLDVEQAWRFADASRRIEDGSFDLIVSDLRLPGGSGFDLLARAKRRDPTVPVVLMTGYGDVEVSVEALRREADDFLVKPLRLAELERTCRRVLDKGRLLRENLAQKRRLEHLYRVKSEFLAGMSHELRTPLTTIIGMSEVLSDGVIGELGPRQRDYVTTIERSARHLLSLINDILDYSKLEAGKMRLACARFPVLRALEDAAAIVAGQVLSRGSRIEIDRDVAPPELWGDRSKVVQVLVNLLSNAVKFSPPGSRVRMACRDADGAARVSVSDPGVGIPEDRLEEIFEEFQQVHGGASGKDPGTGLGLALSRRLARLHGGDLEVESRAGAGSTFTLVLPAHAAAAAPEPVPEPAACAVGGA